MLTGRELTALRRDLNKVQKLLRLTWAQCDEVQRSRSLLASMDERLADVLEQPVSTETASVVQLALPAKT